MTSASFSVVSKLFPFSSHAWSINSAELWWYDISLLIYFSSINSSLILILDYLSVYFCNVIILLNKLLVRTLIWGRFEFPIIISIYDVFKVFVLNCGLTLVYLLLLDLDRTFLSCFLFQNVNAITIYFTFVKYSLSRIKIKLLNWEDVQCHEHWALIDHMKNVMIDSIVFTK